MERKKMLKGYKDILGKLREVWGIDVAERTLKRWCAGEGVAEKFPIKRINPQSSRPVVIADPEQVEAWAQRHIK